MLWAPSCYSLMFKVWKLKSVLFLFLPSRPSSWMCLPRIAEPLHGFSNDQVDRCGSKEVDPLHEWSCGKKKWIELPSGKQSHSDCWNDIPSFNRKYIDSIRVPHFPASYVRLPECNQFPQMFDQSFWGGFLSTQNPCEPRKIPLTFHEILVVQ